MEQRNKKRGVQRVAQEQRRAAESVLEAPHAFLIRIADREDRKRAMMAFLEVREPYHGLPDFQMLVGRGHVEVLRREGIPFDTIS